MYFGVAVVALVLIFFFLNGGFSLGIKKSEPFGVWRGSSETGLLAVEVHKGYYRTGSVLLNDEFSCPIKKWRSGNTYLVNVHDCPSKLTRMNYVGDFNGIELVSIETGRGTFDYPI